jgi:ribosome-associated translation inhibitor RaiA
MIQPDIQFIRIAPSAALTSLIEDHVLKLNHYFDNIQSCRVVISTPHRHHRHKYFHTSIHLHVPRHVLIVDQEPEKNQTHMDAYQSVNDAFAAITKQLETYVCKARGKIKNHANNQPHIL